MLSLPYRQYATDLCAIRLGNQLHACVSLLDQPLRLGRLMWRRECNATIRARILRHQRQLHGVDEPITDNPGTLQNPV